MELNSVGRRHDLDWIRVLATVAVFLYHCLMFFNPFPWHVKNNDTDSEIMLMLSLFIGLWVMPIFFAVSGISVQHALAKRQGPAYLKERLKRLGVPLIFGVFVLTPPQIYIERLALHQFGGSFIEFYPHFFKGFYLEIGGEGNFAFFGLHLWYLLVLLVFSFLTLPLFKKVKMSLNFNMVHFLVLPTLLMATGFVRTQNLGGWDLVFYLIIFIYGYFFFSHQAFAAALEKTIKFHAITAVIASLLYISWFIVNFPQAGIQAYMFYMVSVIGSWSLILCIFFLAGKYLFFSNRTLQYANEAALPFYILHQPVIVIFGFFIAHLPLPVYIKLLFMMAVSISVILLSYHFIIRQSNMLRFLFGIKAMKKAETIVSKSTSAN
ncbi:acyltransferase family protein [Bacillus sp. FJAT-27251]|uniref:acyltransferase family protein n=1 Tax=Bacillus sp. FJAT-27251 TaxID=1684142 RepID=UPI000840A6AA|nr:acyltransferase family protein [Bacillus sp. FJAT-27251]